MCFGQAKLMVVAEEASTCENQQQLGDSLTQFDSSQLTLDLSESTFDGYNASSQMIGKLQKTSKKARKIALGSIGI